MLFFAEIQYFTITAESVEEQVRIVLTDEVVGDCN